MTTRATRVLRWRRQAPSAAESIVPAASRSQRPETASNDGNKPRPGILKRPDLLALIEGSRSVSHGNFRRLVSLAEQFDQQLNVEIEAVTAKRETFEAIAAKDFVHRK